MKNKHLSIIYVFLFLLVGVFFISMVFAGFRASECGNGILEDNEVCDSGNVSGVSGDYCFSEGGCFEAGNCSPSWKIPSLTHTYVLLNPFGNKTSLGFKGFWSDRGEVECSGTDCYGYEEGRLVSDPDYCPGENQEALYYNCGWDQYCIDNAPIGSVMCAPCICKYDYKWVIDSSSLRGKCCPREGNWRYDYATGECVFKVESKANYGIVNLSGMVQINCSVEGSLDYSGYSEGSVEITSMSGVYSLYSYKLGIKQKITSDISPVPYRKEASKKYSFSGDHLFAYSVTEDGPVLFCEVSLDGNVSVNGDIHVIQGDYVSDDIKDIDDDGYMSLWQRNSYADCNNPDGYVRKCVKFNETVLDCDDWYFDDNSTIRGFSRTCKQGMDGFLNALDKEKYCYNDTNNDGVGDFAMCAYCKNPSMTEVADDIDNNCKGSCQGNVSRSCEVTNYAGDGMEDLEGNQNCSGVVNQWGIQDNFCQMVDDDVVYLVVQGGGLKLESCNGYNRAIQYGYGILSEEFNQEIDDQKYCNGQSSCRVDLIELIVFKPGGRSLSPLNSYFSSTDFRRLDAMVGNMRFVKNLDNGLTYIEYIDAGGMRYIDGEGWVNNELQDFMSQYDFLSLNNKEGYGQITRGTSNLPEQYIDSFRGEFNKNFSDKSIFDKFWEFGGGSDGFDISNKEDFVWLTQCVAKDKCADGGDNDGPKDLTENYPFASFVPNINTVLIDSTERSLSESFPILFNLKDMDDPSCKFTDGGQAIADKYGSLSSSDSIGSRRILDSFYKYDLLKHNPDVLGERYCSDIDGDGFCSNSLIFPDCVDSLSLPLGYDTLGLIANDINGWVGLSEAFSGWHVHPFAPIAEHVCTFAQMGDPEIFQGGIIASDINCNKDGLSGVDFGGLLHGSTPFDSDLNTGREYKNRVTGIFGWNSISPHPELYRGDILCHVPSEMENPYTRLAVSVSLLAYGPLALPAVIEAIPVVFSFGAKANAIWHGSVAVVMGVMMVKRGVELIPNTINSVNLLLDSRVSGADKISAVVYLIDDFVDIYVLAMSMPSFGRSFKMEINSGKSTVMFWGENQVGERPIRITSRTTKAVTDSPKPTTAGCFLENTSVNLANGSLMDIEDINVGDEIVAFDLENNVFVNSKITATMVRDETNYRVIEYE